MKDKESLTVGFVGQGYIGKNMADDFAERDYTVVRYALEDEYVLNKESIKDCDVVFIAVPTPTIDGKVDTRVVAESVALTGPGSTVVIKSTVPPGTTNALQEAYPDRFILFSPEFLSKQTASDDARHPFHSIIGLPESTAEFQEKADVVHTMLPPCEHTFTVSAVSAEHYKYIHNVHGYIRIVLANMWHDATAAMGGNWEDIHPMMAVNPMMSPWYNQPLHKSGRGAGGVCFIKDYAAYANFFESVMGEDVAAINVFRAIEAKNLELLKQTEKDADIVNEVYPSE